MLSDLKEIELLTEDSAHCAHVSEQCPFGLLFTLCYYVHVHLASL